MRENFNRRTYLRMMGASSAIASIGVVSGKSDQQILFDLDDKHNLPYDITLSNMSDKTHKINLELLTESKDAYLYQKKITLPSSKAEGYLPVDSFHPLNVSVSDVSSGIYTLRVTANGQSEKTGVLLENNQFPPFVLISIIIKPDGGLKVSSAMA